MKSILVPFDFSDQSVSAFRFALDVAAESKGSILLLHVIELPVLHDPLLMPVHAFEKSFLDELSTKTELKFQKIIEKYADDRKHVKTSMVFGSIHTMIVDTIQKEKIDLVVMGTKGADGLREILIGSNTEKIVRRSPVPVIAVKKYVKGSSIKNIVFPHAMDTGENDDLITKVKSLQSFFKAKLHIIWVNTPVIFKPDPEIRQELNVFAKRYLLKDFTINIFSYTNEEAGILQFTREIKGDLIAMGTHGRTGFAHVLAGSVAEDVVNHVNYPVWTYAIKASK
jgi:nucleotide-binding universal stress UspA family protein